MSDLVRVQFDFAMAARSCQRSACADHTAPPADAAAAQTRDLVQPSAAWRPIHSSVGDCPRWQTTQSGLLWIPRPPDAAATVAAAGALADEPDADGSALEFDVELVEDIDPTATRADDDEDDFTGANVDGRYLLLEEIGAGGIGVVYRARRPALDREVVVKFLRARFAHQSEFVRRFEREALAMGRLHDPRCVAPIDVGCHAGRPYVVMEYVPGLPLSSILRGRPMPIRRAIAIMRQVLGALDHMHRHGVIHRDLKAGNIILTPNRAGRDIVKILDFGMAKFAGEAEDAVASTAAIPRSAQVSVAGIVVGTPSVMAPEQISQRPVDGRADLYAAGVLLYEMITGIKPFRHPDVEALLRMHLHAAPMPPRMAASGHPASPALERVILRALAKRPRDRYRSAREMRRALEDTPEANGTSGVPAPRRVSLQLRAESARLRALAGRCREAAWSAVRALTRAAWRRLRAARARAGSRLRGLLHRRANGCASAALTDGATSDHRADSRLRTPFR